MTGKTTSEVLVTLEKKLGVFLVVFLFSCARKTVGVGKEMVKLMSNKFSLFFFLMSTVLYSVGYF